MKQIKVLIIDDSELVRKVLSQVLTLDPQLQVVGTAHDAYQAREMIKQLNPDVLTLDVEMPRMNGLTFLKNLMRLRPMPVVMISTLTEQGAEVTLEALELGAVDYVAKPKLDLQPQVEVIAEEICCKVKQAATANITAFESLSQLPMVPASVCNKSSHCELIAIGASTGGTEAIKQVLRQLPQGMPPIVVVQHMPAGFTASYANRLNNHVSLQVSELNAARVPLKANHVYIANGARHLEVRRSGSQLHGIMTDADPVCRHKPSVDVLFSSVARHVGETAVGIILTGMGRDGADGMGELFALGAHTIAQDEQSSTVWGMPRVAIEEGTVSRVLPLNQIADHLVKQCFGAVSHQGEVNYACKHL